MSHKKKGQPEPPRLQKTARRDSVFREALNHMRRDFDRLLPEKLRNRNPKKFVLWLFVLELLVLSLAGKFVYEWLAG